MMTERRADSDSAGEQKRQKTRATMRRDENVRPVVMMVVVVCRPCDFRLHRVSASAIVLCAHCSVDNLLHLLLLISAPSIAVHLRYLLSFTQIKICTLINVIQTKNIRWLRTTSGLCVNAHFSIETIHHPAPTIRRGQLHGESLPRWQSRAA